MVGTLTNQNPARGAFKVHMVCMVCKVCKVHMACKEHKAHKACKVHKVVGEKIRILC